MQILQNDITGIIAPKGSGKTYEACRIIKELPAVAVFDTLHEEQYGLIADEIVWGNPRRFAELIREPEFKVLYRTVNTADGFDHFIKLCYLRGKMTAICEEVDQVCSSSYLTDTFGKVINLGRHTELSLVYISRRFARISRDLTANTNRFIFFRVTEPIDLDGIRDRCGTDVAEVVSTLRGLKHNPTVAGEKLIWTADGSESVIE